MGSGVRHTTGLRHRPRWTIPRTCHTLAKLRRDSSLLIPLTGFPEELLPRSRIRDSVARVGLSLPLVLWRVHIKWRLASCCLWLNSSLLTATAQTMVAVVDGHTWR